MRKSLQPSDRETLEFVIWIDAVQPTGQWEHVSEIEPDIGPCVIHSVGWVVAEDEDVLLLAPNKGADESTEVTVLGTVTIPKCSIKWRYGICDGEVRDL